MKFRTEILMDSLGFKLDHADDVLLLGSCFTDNIGNKLRQHKFKALVNPFGVLYNPLSINKHLERLISGQNVTDKELKKREDIYLHFNYHGSFSDVDRGNALRKMQSAFMSVNIENIDVLFITWGTSRVYRLKETCEVVANCHKYPARDFKRESLSVQNIFDSTFAVLSQLKSLRPNLNVVLNVSPVRHLKDGFIENQRNKSRLLLAAEELENKLNFVHYFPSYEIQMDDLRDYRFYADDLLHPSNEAVAYIWDCFSDALFSSETKSLNKQIFELIRAMNHRLFFPESNEAQKFALSNQKKAGHLQRKCPDIDFSEEYQYFTNLLNKNF